MLYFYTLFKIYFYGFIVGGNCSYYIHYFNNYIDNLRDELLRFVNRDIKEQKAYGKINEYCCRVCSPPYWGLFAYLHKR